MGAAGCAAAEQPPARVWAVDWIDQQIAEGQIEFKGLQLLAETFRNLQSFNVQQEGARLRWAKSERDGESNFFFKKKTLALPPSSLLPTDLVDTFERWFELAVVVGEAKALLHIVNGQPDPGSEAREVVGQGRIDQQLQGLRSHQLLLEHGPDDAGGFGLGQRSIFGFMRQVQHRSQGVGAAGVRLHTVQKDGFERPTDSQGPRISLWHLFEGPRPGYGDGR